MNYTEFKEMLLDGTGLGPNGPAHEAVSYTHLTLPTIYSV